MKIHLSREIIERVLNRHASGLAPGRIAHEVKIKRAGVERILQRQKRHEAIMSGELIGKGAQTRIARTPCHLTPLASKRDARGKIDWPGVHGWVDVREEVREVMETLRRQAA